MHNLTVSVNAYQDAYLLDNCLASIRRHIPDATVQVVDGRYESWPDEADNSTDKTAPLARQYDAEYHAAGPFDSEADKHRYRRDQVETKYLLFIDADERLLRFEPEKLELENEYRIRIFNALMYGPRISYYPRFFRPENMSVERVDKFMLDNQVRRTDAVTVSHRADLRSDAYRNAKLERFEHESRDPWYRDYLKSLDEKGHNARYFECPNCGRESVTESGYTAFEPENDPNADLSNQVYSRVRVCTAGDNCYNEIESNRIDHYRYLPDDVDKGFEEDLSRVKLELMLAGWSIAKVVPLDAFDRYDVNAKRWVSENFADIEQSRTNA